MVRLTDRPDMTLDVYRGRKTTMQQQQQSEYFKPPVLPPSVKTLCAFAQFLSRSFKSVNSIKNYLSGIKTLHILLDLNYPSDELIHLRLLLEV